MGEIITVNKEWNEECGVVGVIGDKEAANLIYLSLYALQHRGQEASGIVTMMPSGQFNSHKDFGLVREAFNKEIIARLEGSIGIGHNRYSTQGGPLLQNIQPFFFNTAIGGIAIAQNGNLTNAKELRVELESKGSVFQSTSDTEIFTHLLARAKGSNVLERVLEVVHVVKGAYSLVLIAQGKLYAIRDPHGFRPLVMGKRGAAVVVASETCALDLIGAEYLRDVKPGEIVEIFEDGNTVSHFPFSKIEKAFCAFEPIYFARPDSLVFEKQIYELRKRMGSILARETHVEADIVIAVPDSGVPMALGYAEEAKIPMELGLVRNHYVGRTFIEPTQTIRDFGVKLKLNPVVSVLKDKRVIVVDDSLVRGTTSMKILRMIRKAGAREIHLRLGSPPITHSCYFGVDTPKRSKLLAAQQNINEIRDYIGADSLGFLSLEGLKEALGADSCNSYCYACFNGKYPEQVFDEIPAQRTDEFGGPGLISQIRRCDSKITT
jgi:amidophosphoribosyltransferase